MKKRSFDLTGKAIDCRELPIMGDAGKEIFRALKAACNGVDNAEYAKFKGIKHWGFLSHAKLYCDYVLRMNKSTDVIIRPVDVLGQARIDAAKDGATILFEGENAPPMEKSKIYWDDHSYSYEELPSGIVSSKYVIAYKLIEEKQPSIQSRVLSEKIGLGQPTLSMDFDKDYFKFRETYDELRDAHLELVRENMLLVKENEALAQRIKNLHRAINDAKAALDE